MPLFRRRPLLRAAAVGGGAYMAGKHSQRKQEEAYYDGQQSAMAAAPAAAPAPAPAPAAPTGPSSDDIARLQQLGQLHDQGVLTDEEFAQQKQQILGRA